jgi:tight adherence protein C
METILGSPGIVAALAVVFISVALLSGTVGALVLQRQGPGRRRLQALAAEAPTAASADERRLSAESEPGRLRPLATLVPKSPKDMSRLRRRMARAGYYQPEAPWIFSLAELACAVVAGLLPLAILGLGRGLIFGVLGALTGYAVPGFVLLRQIEARKREIENGLPDALDLLVVCLDAGCAIDAAILKASEELAITYPALAQELKLLMTETRAGKSRLDAFRNLAERTKVDDVRALVAMLIQTDRFGTSVSMALKTHAEVSRTKRRQRAEERAAKVGVKLVFPLVLCLFPAFYVVTLGPAIIQFVRVFFGQLVNQAR